MIKVNDIWYKCAESSVHHAAQDHFHVFQDHMNEYTVMTLMSSAFGQRRPLMPLLPRSNNMVISTGSYCSIN